MTLDTKNVHKGLVTLVIEKVLLDIGKPTYDKVIKTLYQKYHCYLPDCYEHPEYLSEILKELFGNSHQVIVTTIKKELKDFSHKESVERFIQVVC